ncbi:MAG: hypothetical protein BMS9Abin29_0558 [Gemmatimonadota bacterium]|nr:MAG: hypothetical protein BMS9Abin29_0558 [Gemmatimonadota bacterium]
MTKHDLIRGRLRLSLRRLAIAVLGIPIIGCGAARSAGGSLAAGAVERLDREDSTLFALERRLTDSVGVFLQREFAGSVLNPARRTWDEMRAGVRDEADTVAAHLAVQLQSDLNHSLQKLLRDNLTVVELRGTRLARAMADTLTDALGRGMTTRLAASADTLTLRLATAVALSLEEVLPPALHSIMLDVRDSLRVRISDVDRAVADSRTVSGVRSALVGAGAAIVLALMLFAIVHMRRQRRALHALIDAVETAGDEGVRHAVRTCAEQVGVHGWLTDRVAARRGPAAE